MGLFGREGVIENIPTEVLYDRMREMAIIVPVKNENLKLIEGVYNWDSKYMPNNNCFE